MGRKPKFNTTEQIPKAPRKVVNNSQRSLFEDTEQNINEQLGVNVKENKFIRYRDIHDSGTDVHSICVNEEDNIRCYYCGTIHNRCDSVIIPVKMERVLIKDADQKEVEREIEYTFYGEGYYHSFECAYRVVLNNIPKQCNTYPHIYNVSESYLKILHKLIYPDEKLVPAPLHQDMGLYWNPNFRYRRLPGIQIQRNIQNYEVQKRDES